MIILHCLSIQFHSYFFNWAEAEKEDDTIDNMDDFDADDDEEEEEPEMGDDTEYCSEEKFKKLIAEVSRLM